MDGKEKPGEGRERERETGIRVHSPNGISPCCWQDTPLPHKPPVCAAELTPGI